MTAPADEATATAPDRISGAGNAALVVAASGDASRTGATGRADSADLRDVVAPGVRIGDDTAVDDGACTGTGNENGGTGTGTGTADGAENGHDHDHHRDGDGVTCERAAASDASMAAAARAEALVAPVRSFVITAALRDFDDRAIVEGIASRLGGNPVRLTRVSVAHTTLHPLVRAQDVVWTAAGGLESSRYLHADMESEAFLLSPLRYVVKNRLPIYRCRLDIGRLPFPALEAFAAAGATEYVAMLVAFKDFHSDQSRDSGVFMSYCTDRPGGFGDAGYAVLEGLREPLALAFRLLIERAVASAVAITYLGRVAAARVLDGAIRRGDAEVIPAAIWYSDMRAFTPMSEALTLDDTIAFLNEVFEATAGAIADAGGEVLDFIGDAVLAIFPLADDGVARALGALDDALLRLAALRKAHAAHPSPAIAKSVEKGLVGIALALGDVRFGNIGITERLSFSVIGPTVNIVARIEGMTKILGEPVLVTDAFAAAAPDRFVSRGDHALEGISDRRELFGLATAGPRA